MSSREALERASSDPQEQAVAGVLASMRAVVRDLRLAAREAEQRIGIHGAQLTVLQQLAVRPAKSLADLAERTQTDPSSASVVVSRLVDRGLVSRVASPADRRRVEIALTPAGRALVRRAPKQTSSRMAKAASRLPRRDLDALSRGLAAFVRELRNGDGLAE